MVLYFFVDQVLMGLTCVAAGRVAIGACVGRFRAAAVIFFLGGLVLRLEITVRRSSLASTKLAIAISFSVRPRRHRRCQSIGRPSVLRHIR
jgi:hypothetical protein